MNTAFWHVDGPRRPKKCLQEEPTIPAALLPDE